MQIFKEKVALLCGLQFTLFGNLQKIQIIGYDSSNSGGRVKGKLVSFISKKIDQKGIISFENY